MLKTKICDRCGKEFNDSEEHNNIVIMVRGSGEYLEAKDLCCDCRKSLSIWWDRCGLSK